MPEIVDWSPIGGNLATVVSTNIDSNNATIRSVVNAEAVINAFLSGHNINTSAKDFGCIIHIAKWGLDPKDATKNIIAKSNWFVYNPGTGWMDADLQSTKRLYGLHRIYLLAIHLGVSVATGDYKWNYSYRVTHRLPANVQDLVDALSLFNGVAKKAPAVQDLWALGAMEGNPPSEIDVTASVLSQAVPVNFDSTEEKFDNEGLYWWDVSIGVPITSYKQGQTLLDSNGQLVQTNVDTRSVLLLGDLFLKPVDVKKSNFLAMPHIVGGFGLQSQPLHTALVGAGWGPVVSNFYVGVLILTTKQPNGKTEQHYKLGFGLNVPLRTLGAKLGLKSQIQ